MLVELRVVRGPRAGDTIALQDGQSLVLGRGSQVSYRIQDPSISRRHCQIVNTPGGIILSDLGSSNGTYVNGQRVTSVIINPGDSVVIGQNEVSMPSLSGRYPQPVTHPGFGAGMGAPLMPDPGVPGAPPPLPPLPGAVAPGSGFVNQGQPMMPGVMPDAGSVRAGSGGHPAVGGVGVPGQPQSGGVQVGSGAYAAVGSGGQPAVVPGGQAAGVCEKCGRGISSAELADGLARVSHAGTRGYLCPQCWGAFDFEPEMVMGYRIDRKLGAGSFGSVFRATSTTDGAVVALKTIRPEFVGNEKDLKRFFREAETTQVLQHDNIMKIYDFGVSGETCYIAMEFIDGKALHDIIAERGQMDVREAVAITSQIADGLQHAFERGVVHRDVKPENVLINTANVAKLVDFGLAKCFRTSGQSGLTAFGEGLGTLAYMPPEQIDNALMADQRADVYSLGASLYHMLSGRRPYEEKTTRSFIMKILKSAPPPIQSLNGQIPDSVVAVIDKAMAKEPDGRFKTPGDFKQALDQILPTL